MSSRADRFMWAKGDCTVIMPRGSVTEEAQDEFSEEMHPRDDRGVLLGTPAVKVSPVHAGAHDERLSVTEEVAS